MTSRRTTAMGISILAAVVALPLAAKAAPPSVGAAGVGDPYYPLDGNGGYDVSHYGLAIDYTPSTNHLQGVATIHATATQPLARFNLDLDGLRVRSVLVDDEGARWRHARGELVVTPAQALPSGADFTTVVTYDGTPKLIEEAGGVGGFMPTDDGALILGEPHVASTWFPVNDHPTDKAAYTVALTVPEGLEVVGNGVLADESTDGGRTTWTWDATDPMASYLATASIGEFDLTAYTAGGLPYWDAVDPDLYRSDVPEPTTGDQFLYSQESPFQGASYKRLMRTVEVPATGPAVLELQVDRATEQDWDFFFVEAHTAGDDSDWTTLRDLNGHNSQYTGFVCPFWLELHPFLEHYQTPARRGGCSPSGTTGEWWAATGRSSGWETWQVDLSAWAGTTAEVSVSYASDDIVQDRGAFLDDVVTPAGDGSTSFEQGDDPLAGWQVAGPPPGSEPNPNDWVVTAPGAVNIDTLGEQVDASFARQPEIIEYLASLYGPYPFAAAGGTVDDLDTGFALENQTRPVYSPVFWLFGVGDSVVVHELAHQWYGDHVSVERWRDIWLNEGFATYSEWLWSEHDGLGTADETFEFLFTEIYGDPDDPFWDVVIGDPGPELLFDIAVYDRGAMTLHALRRTIGDTDFFALLRAWPDLKGAGNGTVEELIALAEEVSGQQLDAFFQTWLYTPAKPVLGSQVAGTLTTDQRRGRAPASAKLALARTAAEEARTR